MKITDFKNIAISNIKKTSIEILKDQLKTGDIIKVKSNLLPIIYHYGIVLKNDNQFLVFHNDPFSFNKSGGNIVSECFDNWVKGKEIKEIYSTGVNEQEIINTINKNHKKQYHFLNNNCEHFVLSVKNKNNYSPQVIGWSIIALSSIIAFSIILNKNKK